MSDEVAGEHHQWALHGQLEASTQCSMFASAILWQPIVVHPWEVKGLVQKTQVIHNEMVCMVAGAFHTAPREALCHLTWMLPMEVYLEKLTSCLHFNSTGYLGHPSFCTV